MILTPASLLCSLTTFCNPVAEDWRGVEAGGVALDPGEVGDDDAAARTVDGDGRDGHQARRAVVPRTPASPSSYERQLRSNHRRADGSLR